MSELRVVIVAEAPRDAEVVKRLVERVGREELGHAIEVALVGPCEVFIQWLKVPTLLGERRIKPWHGHFEGKPGKADAKAGANALKLVRDWVKRGGALDAVVLQRDLDRQPERRQALEEARRAVPLDVPVVVSAARPKLEAWAICAFEPAEPDDDAKLAALRRELGADPRACSHELDATKHGAKRDAKRVAAELLGEDDDAFAPLCETTPLATLRERGTHNGLTNLLDEAATLLGPAPTR